MTASDHSYETSGDRASLAREAGVGKLSFISELAGVLVACGAFAVLAALVGAAATTIGLTNDLIRNHWARLGTGSAIAAAVVLFLAYLFGGYVAGRMARRAGLLNGLAVFLLAIVLIAAVNAIIASQADADTVRTNLRSLGVPTSGSEWNHIGTPAGIASPAAMLIGALVGGVLGERWHPKLTRRAVSGKYRPGRDERDADGDEHAHAIPPPLLALLASRIRLHQAAPTTTARTTAEQAASSKRPEFVHAHTSRTGPKATGPDQDHCRDHRDGPGHRRGPAAGVGGPAGPDLDRRRRPAVSRPGPVVDLAERRLRLRRALATLLVFRLFLVALAGIVTVLLRPLATEGPQLIDRLPSYVEDARAGRGPVGG